MYELKCIILFLINNELFNENIQIFKFIHTQLLKFKFEAADFIQ